MLDDIGEGKFGLVKLGIHKSTHQRVAIKIIKKSQMKDNDAELVKSEIDIMKLCHHPNVVRLLDHFENAEYIFIVMEYLSGGSLKDYFIIKKYKFDEKRASEIMFQLGLGLQYLHQYGVVHRDLKPDNIMMTETENMSQIKIMDFGLSKIMGPKEHVVDGFGTLSFVAPEVLVRTPYNKEVDIWSLGIILYYMLTGILPFDDDSDNEEIIAKMIVFNECKFPKNFWEGRSEEVIDLIKRCLEKSPEKRINIENYLNHKWFKKFNLGKDEVLKIDEIDEMKREKELNLNNSNKHVKFG
jgi:serine/threonine protein kinase